MKKVACLVLAVASSLVAQDKTSPPSQDAFQSLRFLNGTWEAKAQGNGGAAASGTYTFRPELGAHILARHSNTSENCKGPAAFDCDHGDLLYIYTDAPGQPLKAIYFDNEGHVIHYEVSTPGPTTAIFLSEASRPGPQFRLVYELTQGVMSGKFQMHLPGQTEWKSYLEWSGRKKDGV